MTQTNLNFYETMSGSEYAVCYDNNGILSILNSVAMLARS